MTGLLPFSDLNHSTQALRRIFIEHEDAARIAALVADAVGDFAAAREAGLIQDARGVAILGASGTGKTESVLRALSLLGLQETKPGDETRPFLVVQLSADASLRRVCADILQEFGWPPGSSEKAQRIWSTAVQYMHRLDTSILVLDEIQHVRVAGQNDRAALRDFLKSLVQPRQVQLVPIIIGMPDFEEVLASDIQLRRRYDVVHMRQLEPSVDLARVRTCLKTYCQAANLRGHRALVQADFGHRLMVAAQHAFGEMCGFIVQTIKLAREEGATVLQVRHFAEAYRRHYDCVPALNPFLSDD